MSEEVKIKISQLMFEVGELERFDNNIHNIVEEYSKMQLHEKDQILTQRIIMKQEEEIERLQLSYQECWEDRLKLSEELEELKNKYMYVPKTNFSEVIELRDENTRLNNIINELKWKSIEEYDKGNYDWVLVKYFDGDYECVPCVAEKRFGKWYSIDEKEIRFDVKYFMDMQQLDKLQELKGEE